MRGGRERREKHTHTQRKRESQGKVEIVERRRENLRESKQVIYIMINLRVKVR